MKTLKWLFGFSVILTLCSCGKVCSNLPTAEMETSMGKIVIELNCEKAPLSVLNFIKYAEANYYNGTIFHRVMPTFMIQGGGYKKDMNIKTEGLNSPIINEWKNGLKNKRGTIAMARTQIPDSATSQFFINVVDNDALDVPRGGAAYAVFGKVIEGMDIVDKIKNVKCISHPKYPGGGQVVPEVPVIIESVVIKGDYNREKLEKHVNNLISAKDSEKDKKMLEQRKVVAPVIKELEKQYSKKVEFTASGLGYIEVKKGTGPKPPNSQATVEVHYEGKLVNGQVFDSSYKRGQTISFPLNGVIKGWTEGLQLMNVGSKNILIIPPDLGYGARGAGSAIPPNSWLIFTVELINIK